LPQPYILLSEKQYLYKLPSNIFPSTFKILFSINTGRRRMGRAGKEAVSLIQDGRRASFCLFQPHSVSSLCKQAKIGRIKHKGGILGRLIGEVPLGPSAPAHADILLSTQTC
jgi:hypothetical protein